jgi:hypothetical protein
MALSDDPGKHRGRPRTSHTDENCVIVKGLMRENQRVKVHEITEVTGIAESTVHEIILHLNLPKLSVHGVRKCSLEHESKNMGASLENLSRFQAEEE